MTRLPIVWLVGVVAPLVACNGDGAVLPNVELVEPPYAPLAGGTEVIVHGSGFVAGSAAPNRVFVGGREAVLVRMIEDTQLGVVIPPGDEPGDVEVVVLNRNGNTAQRGVLRYSTPPEITDVSPTRVRYDLRATTITLHGSGFRDEDAGVVAVLVDGQLASDVMISSDTELTFTAPPGRALVWPEITVVDARGTATTSRGFRYAPSDHDGLLLFPSFGSWFAVFVDPVSMEIVPIPRINNSTLRLTAVVRDDRGDYWGFDRSQRFGRIDPSTQMLDSPVLVDTIIPAATRVGSDYLGIDRLGARLGRVDLATGMFTQLANAPVPCCGSFSLATLDGTVLFTARSSGSIVLNTVDPKTGEHGAGVTLSGPPNLHIEDMRAFAGALYAITRNGLLVTIDPVTGTTTTLPITPGRASAMDVFE
ncbi:MAG: IPT/TIG domain-containing protein [Kofleriaceae bacterium]